MFALWGSGSALLLRQDAERRQVRVADVVTAARVAVEDEQQILLREARMLARDPAIVEGATSGDWATLARGASPRMIALSVERLADLLLVLDLAGGTVAQVPAVPRISVPDLLPPATPVTMLRALDGRAWLLGVAAVRWTNDTPVGVVVVGRRLDQVGRRLAGAAGEPALVAVAGDRLLGATRPDLPPSGWLEVMRSGRAVAGGRTWSVRALESVPGVWVAVPLVAPDARLWSSLLVTLALASLAGATALWLARASRRAGRESAVRGRELEALYAVARTMAGGSDVAATAEQSLGLACTIAGVDAGMVCRLEPSSATLTPIAHRGVTPAELTRLRGRAVDGSHAGEAIRSGRAVVTDLMRSTLLAPELREIARAARHTQQVALPISAGDRPWGVLILLSDRRHPPAEDELRLLEAVAAQIGLAVSRASLVADAREKGRRLETLTRLARTLTATLSVDDVLQGVAAAALEVFGGSEARVWLVDEEAATVTLAAQSGGGAPVGGQYRFAVGDGVIGSLVADRTPVVITDLAADPRLRNVERVRAEGLTSFAGTPLLLGDRVLGALSIATRERHRYTEEELGLLQSLGNHAAVAIDNARRFADETRRRAQLAALLEINKRIAAAESSEALLRAIAEEAARLLDVENAGFRLVEGDELVLAGLAGTGSETMLRPRIRVGESFTGRVVAEGRTMVADLATVPAMIPEHRDAGLRLGYVQCLGVPLRAGDRIIGVLAFRSRRPFSARDCELAEAFAGQAALALEHARLYREASRQADRMAALADVERLLAETLESDVVAQRIADTVRMLLDAAAAGVYRVEPETGELVVIGLSTSGGRSALWNPRLPDGHGMVGLAVRERRAVVTRDVLADPRVTYTPTARDIAERSGHRAVLGLPLVVRDRVIGGLAIADHEARVFDAEDVRLAQAFAHQAAVALENARLFGEAARQAQRMGGLADVERLLSETLDPDVVARRIVDSVGTLLGARSAALYGLHPDTREVTVVMTSRDEVEFEWPRRLPPGYGLIGIALAARCPTSTPDILTDARLHFTDPVRASLAAGSHRARLVVPLLVRGRVLGALAVADETGRAFDEQEFRLAQAFADQAAVALENARLFALELARRAQMETLATVERELTAELDLERLLHLIVDRAGALFAGQGVIYLAGDGILTPAASTAEAYAEPRVPFGRGQSGACAAERRGLLTNDYPHEPYALEGFVRLDTRRAMSQPLLLRDRLVGVISMSRRGHDASPFSADELPVLESFATQAAIAIENARLHAEAERRRGEAEELARVARTLTESLEVSSVGERIVESVMSLVPARSAGLRLLAPDGSLVAVAWRGPEGGHFETGHVQPAGTGLVALAIGEGRALWSADVLEDPRLSVSGELRERVLRYDHRAVLVVPLHAKARTIGALIVADALPRQFSVAEVALVRAFADQAALALDNARLHEEAEQRRREAEFMTELARTINASLDLGLVLHRIAEGARELCASDVARIALREPPSERIRFRHWVGARHDTHDRVELVPGRGLSGQVIATGRPFRTDDYAGDPRITDDDLAMAGAEGIVAELSVPIRIAGRVEGLLNVNQRTVRQFTDRDEAILLQLADHAAIAIQNARLYESVEIRAARLRTLATVNRLVSSSLDAAEVLAAIARAAAELMGGPFVAFWIADESARTLTLSAVSDPDVGADFPLRTLAFGEGGVGWAAVERRIIDIPDVLVDPRYVARDWAAAHGMLSFHALPIMLQDSLLGVLALAGPVPFRFSAEDQGLLDSFVSQAAVALHHARLYAETRSHLEETRALLEVAEILNSTLDPRHLLKRIAITIARVCRVDRCTVQLWDGERLLPLMSQFADGRADATMWQAFIAMPAYPPREVPAQARAVQTRRPVVVDDATAADQMPGEWGATFRHKSAMVVPLICQEKVIGLLTLDYTERVTPFQHSQLTLATAIAGQLALSLENTRLYTEAQQRLRETTTLLAVGQALSHPGSPEDVMRRVARETARAMGADMAGAYIVDDGGDTLRALAGYHVPESLLEVFRRQRIVLSRFPFVRDAARDGRPLWSSDPHADDRFDHEWVRAFPPHSVLFAPTRLRGESVGGLFLVWWRPGRVFEDAEIRLMEGVAAQVGLALENAELARQREVRLKETETLLAVSRSLSSTLDVDTLLRQFMRQIARAVGADTVGVWLLDDDGESLVPAAGYRVRRVDDAREVRLSIMRHAFYAEAARTRRPVFSADAPSDARMAPEVMEGFPHRSQLFAPILAKDRMIGGFVAIWWEQPRVFTDGELALIEAISSQAGVAIENARLFQQNRRQVEELSVLNALSRAVTGQLDLEALLDTMRANVLRALDAQKMVVLLIDDKVDEFEAALRVGTDGADAALPRRYSRAAGLAAVVADTGRTLRTDDYVAECQRRGRELPPVHGPRYWVGAPMLAGDIMLGVLAVSRGDRPYTADDERLLGSIADVAALALRSARLFEERTRAYAELAAAQDHLVRTEKLRALGEMASGVAHDFNNLLAAILGRTQLLLRQITDERLRRWLEVVEQSALDGAQTVRRLQDFARVRRDEPKVPVDLNQVVRDAMEMTQSRWHEDAIGHGVTVEVRTALGEVPRVAGDPAELREAMMNLILNAIDAMPAGGTLSLTTGVGEGQVIVRISDTGVGIPADVRDRIFDPFFTTKGPRGTGLGLSMTYGIIARHGGGITVESEPGRGSTFTLTFPSSLGPSASAPAPVPPEAAPVGLRCLVVDDEEMVGEVIGDVLQSLGHRAVVLTDGAEAIARLGAEPFDLVMTDLAMPGVSGWQVAAAVKARTPDVPVFVVTGFGVALSPEERRAHGVEAVFSKPLKIDEIADAMTRVAAQRATKPPEER